jgi:hypothetical protein
MNLHEADFQRRKKMKHGRLLTMLILSAFLTGCAGNIKEPGYLQEYGSPGGRGQGFRAAPYRVTEEAHECVAGTVSGRISRLRVEKFASDLEPGLAVDIQTPDRGLVHVHCGPLKLLDSQEADLKPGDDVTMKVFCSKLAGGRESLLASEIKHKGQTLILRDAEGNPLGGAARKNNS